MSIKKIIALFLIVCPLLSHAQFVTVDWSSERGDSLLPYCTSVVDLPADYNNYIYSAHIEYPEYQKMTAAEVKKYSLKTKYASLPEHPQIECYIGVQAKRPQLDVAFLPVVMRGADYYKIKSYKLVVDRTESTIRRTAAERQPSERYVANSMLAKGKWVRVAVKENGVHKITTAELKNMGFQNPDSVRMFGYGGHLLPEKNIENLPDDLQEVPLWREAGYVLFYANGVVNWNYENSRFVHKQNVYSDFGCYFLTEGGGAPLAFSSETIKEEPQAVVTTYPDYAVIDNDKKSHCQYGRVLVDDYNYSSGRSCSYKFPITGVADTTGVVDLSFATNGYAASSVGISIGDSLVGTLKVSACVSGEVGKLTSGKYNAKSGIADNLVITLTQDPKDEKVDGFLDFLRVNYTRKLALRGSQTAFRGKDDVPCVKFEIDGCNANTRVWDLSSTVHRELKGTLSGNRYSVLAPSNPKNDLVVVDIKGTFPAVEVLGEVENQNLHAVKQADMVIIIPTNGLFKSAAERLADAHRNIDSLTVEVVTAQQLYNEFSSGTPDVTAYRRFMKMLYDRAKTAEDAPKYLLMFGDSWYDNRLRTMPTHKQEDYLLCFESENSVNAIRSYVLEDYMGFLDDGEGGSHKREKVDLGVGRIPTTSQIVANAVVDKLIAYMRNDEAGAWQNVISILGDDGDKGIPNQHMIDAEGIATIVTETFPSFIVDRIYWDDFTAEKNSTGTRYPLVTKAIKERLDKGALVVNYSGHGGTYVFSHELTWKTSDMDGLKSPRIPFWITASCENGPFDKGEYSISETAILNPKGGAIGIFTTTRTVLQNYNAVLNKEFMKMLLSPVNGGEATAVGDAVRMAKCNVIDQSGDLSENKLQYVLLGDPALRLNFPKYRIRVDKINGAESSFSQQATAGSVMSVEGSVITRDSVVIDDFNGTLCANLFDCAEDVKTLNNDKLGVFTYTAHNKKLFELNDSIRNGRFAIKIPIPLDISYRNTEGLLNLFALDSTRTHSAQGHFKNFTIGGTASGIYSDGNGPEIKLYLNTYSFADGDKVNTTPCLLAELYDENGINTIGSGIGHDIIAIIDNDPAHTYNLNSLYTPVDGNYRQGTITLPLNTLEEGEHELMLRAWDLNNNSSVAKIRFVVEADLEPEIADFKIEAMPVVAGMPTTFIVMHNRPQSEIEVTFELYSIHGQVVWKNVERTVCSGLEYNYSWDATASGGRPLQTGVYVLRVYMKSGDGISEPESLKIVVINNKK